MSSRVRSRNAYETQLDGAIGSGDTSFSVDSGSGLTAPLYLVIEPENPSKREYILVASVGASSLSSVTRGLDGSASGAQAHDSGSIVRAVPVHQWLDLIFTDIEALETADTNHFGGTDTADHPEATVSVRGFMSATDKTKLDGIATGAVADHGALAGLADDDHGQYHTDARAVTWHDGQSHNGDDGTAIHDNVSGEIAAVTVKGTPVANDLVLIEDSASSNAKKRATLGSIVSALTEVDHGALTGLGDDDHPQYLLTDGSRGLSGNFDINNKLMFDVFQVRASASGIQFEANGSSSDILTWNGSNWTFPSATVGQVLVPDGALGTPGLAFEGDANTGFFITGNNGIIPWAGNGVNGGHLYGGGVRVVPGSAAAPAFSFAADQDTGIYRVGTDILGLAAGGNLLQYDGSFLYRSGVTGYPVMAIASNAEGAPGWTFASDTDTGMYRPAANTLGFTAGGDDVVRMIDGGSGSSLFVQDGLTAVGDVETLRMNRGSGTGLVAVGFHSSSEAHKKEITPLRNSPLWSLDKFRQIRPVTYRRKGGPNADMREFSFTVEQLEGITPFLTTNGEKRGGSVSYTGMMSVIVDFLQHLDERVLALEAA